MANTKLEINIDLDQFMVEDLEILDKATRREATLTQEIDVFDRVVVGGVRGKYKASEIRKIRDAVLNALITASNDPN
jgi:hypothetical protein